MKLDDTPEPGPGGDDPADHVFRSLVTVAVVTVGTVASAVTAWRIKGSEFLLVATVGLASLMVALLIYKIIAALVFVLKDSKLDVIDEACDVVFDRVHELAQKHHEQDSRHDTGAVKEPEPGLDPKQMRERFSKLARGAKSGPGASR
ncbi:MAG: hypothetical protein JO370_15000 [Paucibacter sp.]|nr:hypothetical protein [Roseateles sp.]